jgi:Signal peptide binding domain
MMSMIPGFSNAVIQPGSEAESQAKVKKFMTIMDSMTDKELDSNSSKIFSEPTRSGCWGWRGPETGGSLKRGPFEVLGWRG